MPGGEGAGRGGRGLRSAGRGQFLGMDEFIGMDGRDVVVVVV